MKIGICLAHNYSAYDKSFVHSMFSLIKHSAPKYELPVYFTGGLQLDEMRQNVVEKAVDDGCDYILCLDTDMVFPVDIVERLAEHLDNTDYDVSCGIYTFRKPPHLPMIFDKSRNFIKEFDRTKPFEIGSAGAGAMMIRSEFLKKTKKPWFSRIKPCSEHPLGIGEEMYFFHINNTKTLCDPTVSCKHIFTDEVDIDTYIERNKLPKEDKVVLPDNLINDTINQLI